MGLPWLDQSHPIFAHPSLDHQPMNKQAFLIPYATPFLPLAEPHFSPLMRTNPKVISFQPKMKIPTNQ